MARAREDLARDYRAAFLRYLPRRDEAALATGYEIGRRSLGTGEGAVTISAVHHDVLAEVVATSAPEAAADVLDAGAEFLAEVLAALDLAGRAALDLTGGEADASAPPA